MPDLADYSWEKDMSNLGPHRLRPRDTRLQKCRHFVLWYSIHIRLWHEKCARLIRTPYRRRRSSPGWFPSTANTLRWRVFEKCILQQEILICIRDTGWLWRLDGDFRIVSTTWRVNPGKRFLTCVAQKSVVDEKGSNKGITPEK